MVKKTNAPKEPKNEANDDLGKGLLAVATAIEGLGEFPASYRMEELADSVANLSDVAMGLRSLAEAMAMSVIAQHGTDEDRVAAVKHLKRHFERGTFEEE